MRKFDKIISDVTARKGDVSFQQSKFSNFSLLMTCYAVIFASEIELKELHKSVCNVQTLFSVQALHTLTLQDFLTL